MCNISCNISEIFKFQRNVLVFTGHYEVYYYEDFYYEDSY